MSSTACIVVLGANGQVAAEVVCRLAAAGVHVIPVCRSHRGSAFLRSQGIAVRHGSIAETRDAERLVGDADIIANFALALGKPAEMRDGNDAIIENALRFSPATSRHVFFSTLAVHPNLVGAGEPKKISAYGLEKLRNERLVAKLGRRRGKSVLTLRLGHVTGALQGISAEIASRIAIGSVALPDERRLANVTDAATIARALWDIAETDPPCEGRFDLTETPPRSWIEVLHDEAARSGHTLRTLPLDEPVIPDTSSLQAAGRAIVRTALRSPIVKEIGTRMLGGRSQATNHRARAVYAVSAAGASIARLTQPTQGMSAMSMPEIELSCFPLRSKFPESIGSPRSPLPQPRMPPFPSDLPWRRQTTPDVEPG